MSSSGYILVLPDREEFRKNFPNAWAAGSAVRIYKDPPPYYSFHNSKSLSSIYQIKKKKDGGNKTVLNANSYVQLKQKKDFQDLVNGARKNTELRRQSISRGNYIRLKKPGRGYLQQMKRVQSVTKNKSGKTSHVRLDKGKKNIKVGELVLIRGVRNGSSSTNKPKRVTETINNNAM